MVFEQDRALRTTPKENISPFPCWFLSLSASVFTLFTHFVMQIPHLAGLPRVSAHLESLRNDSTLSLSDLPAYLPQLLLAKSQTQSAPESCSFFFLLLSRCQVSHCHISHHLFLICLCHTFPPPRAFISPPLMPKPRRLMGREQVPDKSCNGPCQSEILPKSSIYKP